MNVTTGTNKNIMISLIFEIDNVNCQLVNIRLISSYYLGQKFIGKITIILLIQSLIQK